MIRTCRRIGRVACVGAASLLLVGCVPAQVRHMQADLASREAEIASLKQKTQDVEKTLAQEKDRATSLERRYATAVRDKEALEMQCAAAKKAADAAAKAPATAPSEDPGVTALRGKMAALTRMGLEASFQKDRIVVILPGQEFLVFKGAQATLNPRALAKLSRLGSLLTSTFSGHMIEVAGHTDNLPIHRTRYRSNWELSTHRAELVAAFLQEKCKVRGLNVRISGYSMFQPIASNATPAGRARNRRVEVVIFPKW